MVLTCTETMSLTASAVFFYIAEEGSVLKVESITVDTSDPDSYYLVESNEVDHIGTVKGLGNVVLRASVSPDTAETRALIDWQGAVEDATDPLKATVSRTSSAQHNVSVQVNGTVFRQAKVWVVWLCYDNFNNTGPQASDSDTSPTDAGIAFGATNGTYNGMQLRATISPAGFYAVGNVTYNHKRTRESNMWMKDNGTWSAVIGKYHPPGTDDDPSDYLEDNTPSVQDHIYDVDIPGMNPNAAVQELVQKASFINYAHIKLGSSPAIKCSPDYPWHSIVWLEHNGTSWQRKISAPNEIMAGAISVGNGNQP